VQSAVAGTVVSAGPASSGYAGYGNLVVVDVGGGVLAMYAHLSSWSVTAGQAVAVGDRIGAVGCSGMCTGPHLHFELRLAGVPVNPAAYLPAR
jgi:murein DD-endopeptidase MepM/ murein hydrolase activator NlpD